MMIPALSRRLAAPLLVLAAGFGSTAALPAAAPARTESWPSPGLRMIASLDDARPRRGGRVQLTAELRNEGTSQLLVPRAGRCNPTLQLVIWGAGGGVVWAQGLPLCLERGEGPLPIRLAPGGSVSAKQCFGISADTGRSAGHCALLDLPSGAYQVGGSFHGIALPRLELMLAP
ncbi:MAG: hypothetical protein ACREDM_08925 [Methylocella sp.]